MKDLVWLIIFFYSFNTLLETKSFPALVIFTLTIIIYSIKYMRLKYLAENNFKSNKINLNKQKEFFITTITHDFKIPILAQLRGLELLQNSVMGELNEAQKDMIQQISGSCKYVLDMISMFSNAYKFEKNTYKLVYEKFNINELIFSCFQELSSKAKEKNITFSCTSNGIDNIVEADRNEIKKVITNLLINAIDYSKLSERIDVKLNTDGNFITFNILGMGLVYSNSNMNKENRYTTIGHTLGMYLCKKIIEFHNGKMFLTETSDKKNCLSFTIPRLHAVSKIV